MKKKLFIIIALTPLALLASEDGQTDIVERTVNFLIFASIIYYLLSDKVKDYFSGRTKGIQAELDEVQRVLDESNKKVEDAKINLEESQQLALSLVSEAQNDVKSIKKAIEETFEKEAGYLLSSFDSKIELEAKKAKKEIVSSILDELLSSDNIVLSQEDLSKIILKKVA